YVRDDQGLVDPNNPGIWIEVGRSDWGDTAPATVQLGLAVTSHDGCNVTTITFEDWELLSHCAPAVENLTCTENPPNLDLSWQNPAGTDTSQPTSIRVNGTEVKTVPGTATSTSLAISSLPTGQISTISVINSNNVASKCNFPSYLSDQ